MSECPKNYTWACQLCSVPCKDYHISKPAPVQSAEELAKRITSNGYDSCGMRVDMYYEDVLSIIEKAFDAQRQAGREEMRSELVEGYAANILELAKRYAELVEAARPLAQYEDGDAGKCWDPSRIKLGKALDDLAEARKG